MAVASEHTTVQNLAERLAVSEVTVERARTIADNVSRVRETVALAAQESGRSAQDVTLLAASKTRNVGEIMAAVDAGIRVLGENRPQEVVAKAEALRQACEERGLDWGSQVSYQLIGQLQANKINKVLPVVSTVQSVDSAQLAQRLASRAVMRGITVNVMLEVNESGEESKSGCAPDMALDIAQHIGMLDGIHLIGLMTVGAHTDDERMVRGGFARLRQLRERIMASGAVGTQDCTELSMGMSSDLAWAIAEGSTMVRIGTAIFGAREYR